jgi:hypothetical protein
MGSFLKEDITAAVESAKGVCTEDSLKVDDESWGKLSDAIYGIGTDKTLSMKTLPCREPAFAQGFDKLTDFLLKLIDNLSPHNRLGALMDLQCGKRFKIAPYTSKKIKTIYQAENRNLFGEIDQQLSLSEPNPIGISILSKDFFPDHDEGHVLIIVGRSYNDKTNQCEYLIENSWGKTCKSVKTSDEIRCAENNTALWVGRQYLLSHLLDITYLEK